MAASNGKERRRAGTDVDEKLRIYFSGGYADLHCGLGNAGSGGASGMPDIGPPAGVRLGGHPDTYSEAAIVRGALSALEDAEVAILRAKYSPHPPGANAGLLQLEDFALVALLTPTAIRLGGELLGDRRDRELEQAAKAVETSAEDTVKRREAMAAWLAQHEEYSKLVPRACMSCTSKATHFRKVLAQAAEQEQTLDSIGVVQRKWRRSPSHDEVKEALRRHCRVAREGKGEPREAADKLVGAVKREAKAMHGAARMAYVEAQRRVIREIRQVRQAQQARERAPFMLLDEPL